MNSNLSIGIIPILAIVFVLLFILGIIFLMINNRKEGPYIHYSHVKSTRPGNPKADVKEEIFFLLQKSGLTNYNSFLKYYFIKWIEEGVIQSKEEGRVLDGSPNSKSHNERNWFAIFNKMSSEFITMNENLRFQENKKILKSNQMLREESMKYLLDNDYMKKQSISFMRDQIDHYSYTDKGIHLQEQFSAYRNFLAEKDHYELSETPWVLLFDLEENKDLWGSGVKFTEDDLIWAKKMSDFYTKVS